MRLFRLVAACLLLPTGAFALCSENAINLRADGTATRFKIEVADTPEEQSRGLMFVESMPRFEGMLFVNERPRRASFWMKNTLIPLDMLFIDETGVVRQIHEMAEPHSEATIDGGRGVKATLEINGGLVETLGIGIGTEVQHPAFDQEKAVWPCED